MKKKLLLLCFISAGFWGFTQNSGIGLSPTGSNPDPSAGLDINYTNKGFLLPRLTTVQRDAIQNPAISLQIYNTTTNCLQAYMPVSGWVNIACDCQNFPSSAFTFPNNIGISSNVTFNATSSGLTYSWVFDQGSPATSNQQSPVVVWNTPGTYTITLTVTDNIGCSSTTTQTITIINCVTGTATFSYTGAPQQWTVPGATCNDVMMEVWGAEGGTNVGLGGKGGYSYGELVANPGDVLNIYVGGAGSFSNSSVQVPGGWNGGGYTYGSSGGSFAGSGGGASDIRLNGSTLQSRIIVAGGGGGGGYYTSYNQDGGYGGGLTGGAGQTNVGWNYTGGGGGTQVAGGAAGTTSSYSQAGSLGQGANSTHVSTGQWNGGGGGGGYYGGGSGAALGAGGGGGSGYVSPTLQNSQTIGGNLSMPDPNGGVMTGNSGNGFIRISW